MNVRLPRRTNPDHWLGCGTLHCPYRAGVLGDSRLCSCFPTECPRISGYVQDAPTNTMSSICVLSGSASQVVFFPLCSFFYCVPGNLALAGVGSPCSRWRRQKKPWNRQLHSPKIDRERWGVPIWRPCAVQVAGPWRWTIRPEGSGISSIVGRVGIEANGRCKHTQWRPASSSQL